jgi:GNAT superfamily N-acetyltransferase
VTTIRSATAGDSVAVQAIYELSIADAAWLSDSAKESISFAEVSRGEVIYVAEDAGGNVVGFVSVQRTDSFIHHLYVRPEARGKAVGRELLNSLRSWLPQPWRLKCVRENVVALKFYRRNGWEEVGSGASAHGSFVILAFQQSP